MEVSPYSIERFSFLLIDNSKVSFFSGLAKDGNVEMFTSKYSYFKLISAFISLTNNFLQKNHPRILSPEVH